MNKSSSPKVTQNHLRNTHFAGDTTREATAPEVQSIKSENDALKQLVAELSLENRLLKKNLRADD